MPHTIREAVAALVTATLLGAPLTSIDAQERPGWHFGVGGGMSVPSSEFHDVANNGAMAQGFVEYDLGTLPLGLRANVAYGRYNLRSTFIDQIPGANDGHASTTSATLDGLWRLTRLSSVQAYLVAGAGFYRRKVTVDDPGPSEVSAGPFLEFSNTEFVANESTVRNFGINGGAGIGYRVGAPTLFLEARYETDFAERRTHYVPVVVGLRW